MVEFKETACENSILKSRLNLCEVCGQNDAKYTCPKCEVKTCCLNCVNIHKKELECDGIRNRTKFIPIPNFTNSDFYNDYAFLEECSRFVYGKQRNIAKRYTNIDKPLPHHLNKLKRVARDRGTVLLFLPEHFARRRSNTSRVTRSHQLLWKTDWIFADFKISDTELVPEDTKLGQLLQAKLESGLPQLDCFKAAGVPNIRLFIKVERMKDDSGKYYELESDLSLKQNLVGKCIVEFPIILAMIREHSYGVDVIQSDDEQPEVDESKQAPNVTSDAASETRIDAGDGTRPVPEAGGWNRRNSNKRRRHHSGELTTVKVARQEKEKIKREIEEEARKKPRNLLFVTGYSSNESGIEDSDNENAQ